MFLSFMRPSWQTAKKYNQPIRLLILFLLAHPASSLLLGDVLNDLWKPMRIFPFPTNIFAFIYIYLEIIVPARKKIDLLFYIWLFWSALEANLFLRECGTPTKPTWYRRFFFALIIIQTLTVLNIALDIENGACGVCLRESVSLADVSTEGRERRSVYVVSMPAVERTWFVRSIRRIQGMSQKVHARIFSAYTKRYYSSEPTDKETVGKIGKEMEKRLVISAVVFLRVLLFLWQWLSTSRRPLFSLQTEATTLLLICDSDSMIKGLTKVVSNLVCCHGIEINGVLFGLKQTGWLDGKIQLQDPRLTIREVVAGRKTILSRTWEGETFFTVEEIMECAKELIKVSPSYDMIMYNNSAFNHNLIRIINDDRPNLERTPGNTNTNSTPGPSAQINWVYIHPLPNIIVTGLFHYLTLYNSYDPFTNTSTVTGLIQYTLGILMIDHLLKRITYSVSTAYGRKVCPRRAGLILFCALLVPRAMYFCFGWRFAVESVTPMGRVMFVLLGLGYGLLVWAFVFQLRNRLAVTRKR